MCKYSAFCFYFGAFGKIRMHILHFRSSQTLNVIVLQVGAFDHFFSNIALYVLGLHHHNHCARSLDSLTIIYAHHTAFTLPYYTLSHPENDRDVTEHAQGYTLHCKTHPLCVNPGVPYLNAR